MRPVLLLMLGVSLAACGGPSTPGPGPRDGRDPSAGGDGCGPSATRLGRDCWSAEGTRWQVSADGPGGSYRFTLALLAAGRVRATDHDGADPAHDEWFQDGETLRVFLSDRFVEYRASVTNGTVLIGEAHNVRGQRWSFRADRDFGPGACAEDEARLDEACMSVAGTRWDLGGRVVTFLDEGQVAVDDAEPVPDAWTQRGAALSFQLAAEGPAHEAEVSSRDTLSGTVAGAAFEATRVPTIAPVMHE